jgi:peroxiredoxin
MTKLVRRFRDAGLAVICSVLALACAPSKGTDFRLPPTALAGTDGASHALVPEGGTRLTVAIFFAGHCPCQAAHDARLRELYSLYHPRGVDVLAVDSETSATLERDRAEAEKRGYPFPIVIDPGGALARQVGAEYATEAFILDRSGTVRYHGGIDSDRSHLRDDATPYLREALDDLLADRPMRHAESKALGCALQTM